ncbi:MAG: MaoC/PaaZ C-terminal domain-containing protein [Marinobacter sp.]|uniref:MaoC family dehydratase n=1 Tax=Marinobacter sp. TaxID=50741 RepID=UPI0034A09A05
MRSPISYRTKPPSLWRLYGKALLSKRKVGDTREIVIPELGAKLVGVSSGASPLTRYQALCGFSSSGFLPIPWPHLLAFPLHLHLLTESAFPLPLLGLVHLRNRITHHRPINVGEPLDISVMLSGQVETARGLEFDLVTEVSSAGEMVWEETSTNLHRVSSHSSCPDTSPDKAKAKRPPLEIFERSLPVTAAESIGRRYGKLSGDFNPIHMHALAAKTFGFPRAIAHGMWSMARCLALLENHGNTQSGPVTVTCDFKKPLFLPGEAQLNWQHNGNTLSYQLLNDRGDLPHLGGVITFD